MLNLFQHLVIEIPKQVRNDDDYYEGNIHFGYL